MGVLRRFQHCTGHITTGSWKGRGNQYIEFARVVYCKLPTNGKQLPAFPLEPMRGSNPGLRGGRRECYHSATVAPEFVKEHPEMYDKEHGRFHDRHRKEALWAEISAELKLQPFDVTRWFESQRTRYGKLSKLQSGQAQGR